MANTTDLSNLDNQTSQTYGTGAFVVPAGKNAQRPKTPQSGMLRLNTTTGKLEYYSDKWSNLVNIEDGDARYVVQDDPKISAEFDAQGNNIKGLPSVPSDSTSAISLEYLEDRFTAGTGINSDTLDGQDSTYYATQFDVIILDGKITQVATDLATHVADHENLHQVTKAQVGLDRVDNTNDLEKPLSDASVAALYGTPPTGVETTNPKGKLNRAGDTMQGNLSMGGFNLLDVNNWIGSVWYFALPSAPAGFLEANGAEIQISIAPRLFAKIGTYYGGNGTTTFKLPDLRGMFVRGLDQGRGVDVQGGTRLLGSTQQDMNQNHTHVLNDPGHTHPYWLGRALDQNRTDGDPHIGRGQLPNRTGPWTSTSDLASSTTGITIQASGGAESRPKNVAMLACIMI